jgi:UDP-glucose 4-epimerase
VAARRSASATSPSGSSPAAARSTIRTIPYDEAYEAGFEDMERRVPNTDRAAAAVGFRQTLDLDGIIDSVVEDQRS